MTTLVDLQSAVVAAIKTRLPALRECKAHDGRFDLEELKVFTTNAPAVRVALLGTRDANDVGTGEYDHEAILAAFIVCRDAQGLPRGQAAAAIATSLLALIPGASWGLEGVFPAAAVRCENLYSNKLQGHGLALWAVTWLQTVRLGTDVWQEDGTFPPLAYARYDEGRVQEIAVDLREGGDA